MGAPTDRTGVETQAGVDWALQAARAIWGRLAARDFRGWDPYDALNGRLVPSSLVRSRMARRVVTQVVKRSPVPLQPVLGVKQEADAYTLGHALLAAARLHERGALADAQAAADRILATLRAAGRNEGGQLGWGYHFPVHTRFFSYEPTTPNLIVTAFVAKGMAAATRAGLADCRDELRQVAAFVLNGLPRVTDETGQCIGYIPRETAAVHNANLLAALVLCEAAELAGEPGWIEEAAACARFSVARQAEDGSWAYSEEAYGRWVDGFHTGFVLEGLARVVRATGDEDLRRSLLRGTRYYVAQLFGPAGEPKYYPAQTYPLDALSAAQGVETLQVALAGTAAAAVPGQLDWIRDHLVDAGGRVTYQVHKRWTDRREFPRWASAPLLSALAGVAATAPPAAPSKGAAA